MAPKNIDHKIQEAARQEVSPWKKDAQWRRENRAWLDKSFEIALKIQDVLEDKGWKQKELAARLEVSPQQVSKILKGQENLSLATIAKIEEILETPLITVPSREREPSPDL